LDIKSEKTYKKLFETYYNPLCNFAYKLLGDKAKAEDVVQDVFVQMWEKRNRLNINKSIQAYLFQATKNKVIEWVRKEKLFLEYEQSERLKSNTEDLDQEAEKYMRLEKLYTYVRQLPPKCQEVFIMSKMNGLTYREIAEDLNISIKTVENQIGRALHLLRQKFGKKI
jgi:RNA polymerase sigma-70 factor (ECF subfamily)